MSQREIKSVIYLFHRKEGFYPLELRDNEEAIQNATCNKGTLMITTVDGEKVWENPEELTIKETNQ